jgi:hypothetical protein
VQEGKKYSLLCVVICGTINVVGGGGQIYEDRIREAKKKKKVEKILQI